MTDQSYKAMSRQPPLPNNKALEAPLSPQLGRPPREPHIVRTNSQTKSTHRPLDRSSKEKTIEREIKYSRPQPVETGRDRNYLKTETNPPSTYGQYLEDSQETI